MKEFIKISSWINIMGFQLISLTLILVYLIEPFAWGDYMIALNLFISIPFVITAIIALKNKEQSNKKRMQITLILVLSFFYLPIIFLPFTYELGGVLISFFLLGIVSWGIFKLKNPLEKIKYINMIGVFVLFINTIFVIGYLCE